MQIQTVHYLFNVHHLRLVDFCDTDVVFGSDGEPSLKDKAEIGTRIKTPMPKYVGMTKDNGRVRR